METQASLLNRVKELQFEDIDLPGAQSQLESLRTQLATLTRPDSNLAMIKVELDAAEALQESLDQQLRQLIEQYVQLKLSLTRPHPLPVRPITARRKG